MQARGGSASAEWHGIAVLFAALFSGGGSCPSDKDPTAIIEDRTDWLFLSLLRMRRQATCTRASSIYRIAKAARPGRGGELASWHRRWLWFSAGVASDRLLRWHQSAVLGYS